ncbi:serine/threonine-protein phosphatase [Streptomyces sp. NBC_01142]|uniref:PP2C family protein-serine/threonine phosphatase n=1 Tax=Streptomyces sp. NBC_01142 TaxID=2975865 RepID=UPI002259F2ED|nr:PP2C family protein-serine/threonine phosphatase [Streptomyces sp. NBC_01142]MCX4820487.1 serine/threonine-protein phosphatase [Streptomyces sp. NBC_01142]
MCDDPLGPGCQAEIPPAGLSTGVAVLGTDTRYLFADAAYCRISGEDPTALVGRTVSPQAERKVGSAALVAGVLADGTSRTQVGAASRCTWHRLTGHGRVLGAVGIVAETASAPGGEQESATYRLDAADDAGRIGTTLDEGTSCVEAVNFLVPRLCDAAAVDLLPEPPSTVGDPRSVPMPMVYRAAVAGRADLLAAGQAPREASSSIQPADSLSARAMQGGHPVLDDRWMAVPLIAHDRVRGVVLVARMHGSFGRYEALTIRSAARRAALAIDHARLFAQAQRTAVELQRALQTAPGRPHPNLQLATRYLPTGTGTLVGGDWFETVRLHFGRTLLVMGDVMGHGVEAAVDMSSYRSMLRDVAAADLPPHRVLRQLDLAIAEATARRPATCLLVRVDPARAMGSFSSAGHLPPAVFSRDGAADLIQVPVGPPLGTGVGGYDIVSRALNPGDTLLLFTDGLVERRGEDIDSSLARLARVHPAPGHTVDELVDEVLGALDAAHAEDDVALMAARIRHRPVPEHQ